ncbi:hypothetical protein LCGC14_0883530 [marine sediment metagenome]|uniref:Uncharacterized protein n=1 Tax=marine sediment metagenome TaxID=412755 RepID=A0A0F9P661_9ZZZZ
MKRLLLGIISTTIILICIFYIGCDDSREPKADILQSIQTEQMMSEAQRQIGMPNIVNFQQRKLMKLIYELCDKEDLICYAYIKSDYQGKLFFIGKCIGYGIPFSAQYTNPEKVIKYRNTRYYSGSSPSTIPQPDPNGLYMPTSSSATWLMMINPETNKPRPVYIEPAIVVSPFKLHKNTTEVYNESARDR